MALKRLPYRNLHALIRANLSVQEDPETNKAIRRLTKARRRGYLTKAELIRVCRWKSSRAIHNIRKNHEKTVKRVTNEVFKTKSEERRITLLTSLKGVGLPMASSILMLTNPRRYGVIDIRVWQVLFKMRAVNHYRKGVGFHLKQWSQYLMLLRHHAKIHHVGSRTIERALFKAHQVHQTGKLYA